ncbi:efflux RND transporter periplasmic adaptor subunit [Marinobacter sp. SS21]|uniref:efflux RND transporter periplasmic adaptor subunit n=1 Tax=Marinobacter sp. SS21 TaxID=2979460 RepID=UPI00232B1F41|nr:efflux RND transporter periplasmic adaptor subunit [Marinobacter sp. SS21]MDC0662346.1 efflux RND transporter periplasmic adaptor subunit [Marinobacter sp. SS21]
MRVAFIAVVVAIAFSAGWLASRQTLPTFESTAASGQTGRPPDKEPLYWVAPMDPNYRRDKPGKSPMGMDLVPVYEEDTGRADGGVRIRPAVRASLGVRTQAVTQGPVSVPIRTVGYVTDDEEGLIHVHSRIAGWIEVLHTRSLGEKVRRGEPLYEIYSPELVNAQQEFLMSERMNRDSAATTTGGKLRALGMTDAQIANLRKTAQVAERITVFAPRSGYVASLPVRTGMYVRPDSEIMAIGSRSSVWVIAEFFERQAGLVRAGQAVEFTTPSMPGTQWQGSLDYVYPELDATTRTLRARMRVPNGDGRLRPNMFVDLTMNAPIGDNLLTIPRQALIQRSDRQHVLVAEDDGYFRPALVTTGQEAGDRVVIEGGLEPGQKVVVSAQFLIDSETNLEAALLRLETEEQRASDAGSDNSSSELIGGVGRIAELDTESNSITLDHAPIDKLNWPAMIMAFDLAKSVSTDTLALGQLVNFSFRETPEGYLVESVQPAQDAQ